MREEGGGLRKAVGARTVDIDVAGAATVAALPGEFEKGDVAVASLSMAVLHRPERMLWVVQN